MNGSNRGTVTGSIVALVSAAIGLATAFGFELSPQEQDAILAFTTAALAIAPLVGAAFDHSHRQAEARKDAAATIASSSGVPQTVTK